MTDMSWVASEPMRFATAVTGKAWSSECRSSPEIRPGRMVTSRVPAPGST